MTEFTGTKKSSKWQIRPWLDRIQPPDSAILVASALVVGGATGLAAVVFVKGLDEMGKFTLFMRGLVGNALGLFLVMGLAGLIVGLIIDKWASEAKGHGVPEVMEALVLNNGRIRPRVAIAKVIASSLTIGAGGSAGREGPVVQTGAALGSTVGQKLHLSAERVGTLVACGAAAGVAAMFNAPIAGSIFALEVILGKFTVRYFGAVVMSAVSASIVGRIFLGDRPAFEVPAYPLNSLGEIPIYIVLGLLAGLVAVGFIRILYRLEGIFDDWKFPLPLKTAIGMAATLGVAGFVPDFEVLGPGLDVTGDALAHGFDLPILLMLLLLVGKLIATSFTLGGGNSGGVFSPALFMGAMLGGIIGSIGHQLWPEMVVNPGAYAIVGMAAVFAGAARAPITGVLIVFEMSNDYKLILPLMLATVLSTLLAEQLFSESIYTLKLKLKGISTQRGRDLDLMQSILVREAMTKDVYVVQADMTLEQLGRYFQQTHAHSFPVVDEDFKLVGMISLRDYDRALADEGGAEKKVEDVATMGDLLIAYEDESLSEVIRRLAVRGVNKMPVVSRNGSGKVVGVIRRRDVIRAYNIALTRRMRGQIDEKAMQLRHTEKVEFLDIRIPENGRAAYRSLSSLAPELPQECVFVSLRRHGNLLIPHGDTVLQPDDVVTVFIKPSEEEQLKNCLLAETLDSPQG